MDLTLLFQQAENISEKFLCIAHNDEVLDTEYNKYLDALEQQYNAKLEELNDMKVSYMKSVSERIQPSHDAIEEAKKKLKNYEDKVPSSYMSACSIQNVQPSKPDFTYLDGLLLSLSSSFGGLVQRIVLNGTISTLSAVQDYLNLIRSYRLYLDNEERRNQNYHDQEEFAITSKVVAMRDALERKRQELMNKAKQKKIKEESALMGTLNFLLDSRDIKIYENNLIQMFISLGESGTVWGEYKPLTQRPKEIMLGTISFPTGVPVGSSLVSLIQSKVPIIYKYGKGIGYPLVYATKSPLQLLITYSSKNKSVVMGGVQSILLKFIRFMPTYSFSITFIDPVDRGSNLGKLQVLENVTTWDLCSYVCTTKESIVNRLKELESFIDSTCYKLAGLSSVDEYNNVNDSSIRYNIVVINDLSEDLYRVAGESIAVLIKNASKCGISLIFTQTVSASFSIGLPESYRSISEKDGEFFTSVNGVDFVFTFDSVCNDCDTFLKSVMSVYLEGLRIDNSFCHYFSPITPYKYKESTYGLSIPFVVDTKGNLVDLELGGDLTTHALLIGSIGSGKTTTLRMIITSIVLNYHPDDVELWLVDYGKSGFIEYIDNIPPHVKFVGLGGNGKEFTFSLLKSLEDECRKRVELFTRERVNDITEYKLRHGVRSIPRIVLIVDEFHQLVQDIRDEPEYITLLDNLLVEHRKQGLTCFFSDQVLTEGLRGLTNRARMQIQVRLAMKNASSEIRETLAVDNSFYSDELVRRFGQMGSGDIIFKRTVTDRIGESHSFLGMYKTIFVNKEERKESTLWVTQHLGSNYKRKNVIVINRKGREYWNKAVFSFFRNEQWVQRQTLVCIGTPLDFSPYFYFGLQDEVKSNIIMLGHNTEMRVSVLLSVIYCYTQLYDGKVFIFADKRDDLYSKYRSKIKFLLGNDVQIVTDLDKICSYVDEMSKQVIDCSKCKNLIVWLGMDYIAKELEQFESFEPKGVSAGGITSQKVFDTMNNAAARNAAFRAMTQGESGVELNGNVKSVDEVKRTAQSNISKLIIDGPRFGIHNFVVCTSFEYLIPLRFVKLEYFKHRIAFSLNRDDWSECMGRVRYIDDISRDMGVYYGGDSSVYKFRPFLFRELE